MDRGARAMDTVSSGDWKRLADLMNKSRAKQQLTWDMVAARAGVSVALLRNIRKGRAAVTLDSELAIERGLDLPEGWVQRALSGKPASPDERQPEPEAPDLRDETERELWSMFLVPEDLRWQAILRHREQHKRDAAG